MKESEKDSMAKKDRRARQTNGQKWTKENGNKWASKTCKSNGRQRRTKGTGVKVVTRDRDREEASSKVVLRKLAIWDVISEIAILASICFHAYSSLCFDATPCFVSINISSISMSLTSRQ